MPEVSAHPQTQAQPFEMKAGQFTIPTLVLREVDALALDAFLSQQAARMPEFFRQAPISIDVSQLDSHDLIEDLPMVVGLLRGHGMIPVGVRGVSEEQRVQAQALELALMPVVRRVRERPPAEPAARAEPAQVVDKPVRSGQRIYAQGRDLVLLKGVSSGAEVMADGHIHAYGPLRGRAMAGVCGDRAMQIFCRELAAELVSIAGRYRVSEGVETRYLGRAVRITLAGDALKFALL